MNWRQYWIELKGVCAVSSTHVGLTCRESEGNGLSREMSGDSRSSSDEANVMTSSHCTAR